MGRVNGDTLDASRADVVDAWASANGVRCLYLLARADDFETTRLAEEHGFRLVDVRVTLAREGDAPPADDPPVRPSRPSDVPALERIAGCVHRDTRFYHDPDFPRDGCDELYRIWIAKSCRGYADVVLVAEAGGEPAGYMACHRTDDPAVGQIGLVGVDAAAQGRGLGAALVRGALAWFAENGMAMVTVVTQGRNCAAQRLYQRAGFVTRDVQLWFHKWYDGRDA